MNQEIRNYVMQKMNPFLDNGQTLRLERILEEVQLKQASGVEIMLRKMGIASEVGHEKIDTTLRYAQAKQSNVKSAHKKYIG